jgi:hypothetical protein
MESREIKALFIKASVFVLVGLFFWYLTPNGGLNTYRTLIILAAIWAVYETAKPYKKDLRKSAFLLGLFLMIFDFVVENLGYFGGLWTSPRSAYPVISVPIEIIALTLIGGYAWAMHLPRKFNKAYFCFEILIFGFFGALGEFLLIKNGMMIYTNGWTSVYAFLGYVGTWIVLFAVWYKLVRRHKAAAAPAAQRRPARRRAARVKAVAPRVVTKRAAPRVVRKAKPAIKVSKEQIASMMEPAVPYAEKKKK